MLRPVGTVMNGEIVHRHIDAVPGLQLPDMLAEELGFIRVRTVIIQLRALFIGELVMPLVIAVMPEDADFLPPEAFCQPVGQCGLSAAGPAGNPDQNCFHRNLRMVLLL